MVPVHFSEMCSLLQWKWENPIERGLIYHESSQLQVKQGSEKKGDCGCHICAHHCSLSKCCVGRPTHAYSQGVPVPLPMSMDTPWQWNPSSLLAGAVRSLIANASRPDTRVPEPHWHLFLWELGERLGNVLSN